MRFDLPIAQQIYDDPSRSERDLQVWRKAFERLDLVEWRAVKLEGFAKQHRFSLSTVSAAFDRLVAAGYLCRRQRSNPGPGKPVHEFRIPLSRSVPTDLEQDDSSSESDRDASTKHENTHSSPRNRPHVYSKGVI